MAVSAGYADSSATSLRLSDRELCPQPVCRRRHRLFWGAQGRIQGREPERRCGRLCFDAGAILITASIQVPEPGDVAAHGTGLRIFGVGLKNRRRKTMTTLGTG